MTTATGDVAIDFTGLANADPYTNSNLTLVDTGFNVKILSAVLRPSNGGSGQFGPRRLYYNGSMTAGATLRSTVEIGNAGVGDEIQPCIIKSDGSGYILAINQTSWNIKTVNAAATTGGLISGTAGTTASGDLATLELNQTTHTLVAKLNGVQVGSMTVTDSTYTTGLAPGISFDAENSSASTIKSWAGDGAAVVVAAVTNTVGRRIYVLP